MLLYLSFLLLFVKTNGLTAFGNPYKMNNPGNNENYCFGNEHPGIWKCVHTVDGTLNVTYDCAADGHLVTELLLWSSKYPGHMESLTIQNCDKFILDITDRSDYSSQVLFTNLQVVNISNFIITHKVNKRNKRRIYFIDGTSDPKSVESEEIEKYLEDSTEKPSGHLPSEVIFENIKLLEMEDTLLTELDVELRSLKIINTTIKHLRSNFVGQTHLLKELVFDNVVVLKMDPDIISFEHPKGVVKIFNSTMDLTVEKFLNCNASKVIVSGNTFKELGKNAFKCQTDEFTFSDNRIENLLNPLDDEDDFRMYSRYRVSLQPNSALLINSTIVNIQGNIIHYVEPSAFAGITAPKSDKISKSPKRIFNFSNNQIYNLEPHSLTFQEGRDIVTFDSITIANNSINCSCHNVPWFLSMAEQRFDMHRNAFYITKKNNQNRCFNIPNCNLGQVMYNFYELCESKYECPANVSGDGMANLHSTLMIVEESFKSIMEATKDTADSNRKLLKIAMEEKEETKYLLGNFSKIPEALSHPSGIEKGPIEDEQSAVVSLLVIITSCIIVILILNCAVIVYSKMIGSVRSPCLAVRYNRHNNAETELTSSRMSLNP